MMKQKGVNYDVGTHYASIVTRPLFDSDVVHREIEIIKNDLHCNSVRISGQDNERLLVTAEAALQQGLEVWLSPLLHDKGEQETLDCALECASAAEKLRQKWHQIVFVLGCELTVFMPGILAVRGNNVLERLADPAFRETLKTGAHNKPLNVFLSKANEGVREVFRGQVTYASAAIEKVDWSLFDFVCLDYYRGLGNRNSLRQRIEPYFEYGKPVIVTEVGCCTYQGAEDRGGLGWTIIDQTKMPVQQLDGNYVRDETLQARELTDILAQLNDVGVDGTFVYTFVIPALTHSEDPKKDLDMASYSLVKSCADNKHGTTYPEMTWEPKESFRAVADYYATH